MDTIDITHTNNTLIVKEGCIDNARFECVSLQNAYFNDVTLAGAKIINANLSDLEIEGAQLGGAYIHNIGMPPEGHPFYDPNAKQRPLKFEHCDLEGSEISDCNLTNVELNNCTITGMKINGIPVEELLQNYEKAKNQ